MIDSMGVMCLLKSDETSSGPGAGGAQLDSAVNSPRKNKRKSQEPRKFHLDTPPATPDDDPSLSKRRRRRLNSTGSENHGSPENSESRTPSPEIHKDKQRLSPLHIAPKKRFKMEGLRELQRLEEEESTTPPPTKSSPSPPPTFNSNPFRPWKEGSGPGLHPSPSLPLVAPPTDLSSLPMLMQRLGHEMQLALLSAAVSGSGTPQAPTGGALPIQLLPQAGPLSLVLPQVLPPQSVNPPQTESPVTPPVQDEPLSLVKKKSPETKTADSKKSPLLDPKRRVIVRKGDSVARQKAGLMSPSSDTSSETLIPVKGITSPSSSTSSLSSPDDKSKQRNYKNLTRARRIEANARERQRVHTITAAFDTLQAAIPTEQEKGVKLSKLSVIKIATAYIMALSRMAGHDYTEDQSAPSLEEVIQNCRQTIINETRIKKRA